MMGFGCALLDYDGDGKLDVLLVARDHVELYRNRGDGTFENVTAKAFPGAVRKPYLMGCSVCDYDGDGRPDLLITGYGRTILYHNQGDGTFKDVTAGSGLEARGPYDWTTSAAWADVDGDGKPALYVCRYVLFTPATKQTCTFKALDGSDVVMTCGPQAYAPEVGSLYKNAGGGRFIDITKASGLGDAHGKALGCMFCDFLNNGRPGLFIANDQTQQDLYVNTGRGKFRNVALQSGVAFGSDGSAIAGMGLDWGDDENRGRFDLLVSNFSGKPKSLFRSDDRGSFSDAAALAGIVGPTLTNLTFGAHFIDLYNKGLQDIVLTNGHVQALIGKADNTTSYLQPTQLFRNLGQGRFEEIGSAAGPDIAKPIAGRGMAVGDFDGDGRQDLLIVDAEGMPRLLHNDAPPHHYLNIRCLTRPGGPDALGARATVASGKISQLQECRSSGSYLSSDAPGVHFGLGDENHAARVTIRWPQGTMTQYSNVAADHSYVATPGDDRLTQIR
jgi:hypothetical protein